MCGGRFNEGNVKGGSVLRYSRVGGCKGEGRKQTLCMSQQERARERFREVMHLALLTTVIKTRSKRGVYGGKKLNVCT